MMHLLTDAQRQLLIQSLFTKDRATGLLRRTGYLPDDDLTLIALLSGVDTKVWVEKP